MTNVTWEDRFSVSDPRIDAQHRHLFSLMNVLDNVIRDDPRGRAVEPAIDSLVRCSEEYLLSEENVLERARYPTLETHRRMHRFFLGEGGRLKENCRAGRLDHAGSIVRFLRDWFVYHVFDEDRKYVAFIRYLCSASA